MQISRLTYTKNWTQPADFPVVVANETQARRNIQQLHDEVRDYLNGTLVPAIENNTGVKLADDSQPGVVYRMGVDKGLFYIEEVV